MTNAQILRRSPLAILKAAQRQVIALFAKVDALGRGEISEKSRLLHEIGQALSVQLEVEETLYYPAVQKMKGEFARRSVARALQDHDEVKVLLKELADLSSENRSLELKGSVLRQCVLSHFELEESQLFSYSETLPPETLRQLSIGMETLRERFRMNQRWARERRRGRDVFYPTLQDRNGAPEDDRDTPRSFGSSGEMNERHPSDFEDPIEPVSRSQGD